MPSEQQAEANRQNALKSTGPRTAADKAVVALNGIKHGLLSREILIKGEREADLVDFGKRLREVAQNWPAVQRAAAALPEKKPLTGNEVKALYHGGELTKQEAA
jgi:hypothetical protein